MSTKLPSKFLKIRNGLVWILKYFELFLMFEPSEVIIAQTMGPKIDIV